MNKRIASLIFGFCSSSIAACAAIQPHDGDDVGKVVPTSYVDGGVCDESHTQDVCFTTKRGDNMQTIGHCAYGTGIGVCCTGCIKDGVCMPGTSDTNACGGNGSACNECKIPPVIPEHPEAFVCMQNACVESQCVWNHAAAGTICTMSEAVSGETCNGYGVCENVEEDCMTTADCSIPPRQVPPCHVVRCNDTVGPRFHKCDVLPFANGKTCITGTCAIATAGDSVDLCAASVPGSVPYLCDYTAGPELGPGACDRPEPGTYPNTWCCKLKITP
jgi:hypothetical protein